MIRSAVLLLVLILASPAPAATSDRPSGDTRDRTSGQMLSNRLTDRVTAQITADFARCAATGAAYRTECFKWTFRLAWQTLDGNRAYRTAQVALERVDRSLGAYVTAHYDTSRLPRTYGFQIYRPILPDAGPGAEALVADLLDEALAALGTAPERTGDHYARIAAAIRTSRETLRIALVTPARRAIPA